MDKKILAMDPMSANDAVAAGLNNLSLPVVDESEALEEDRNKRQLFDEFKKTLALVDEVVVSGTSYTLLSSDQGKIVRFTNSGAKTLTIPLTTGFTLRYPIIVRNAGAGDLTIEADGGATVNMPINTVAENQGAVCHPRATDNWDIYIGGEGGSVSIPALNTPGSLAAGTPTGTGCPLSWTDTNTSPNESSLEVQIASDSSFTTIVQTLTPAANATSGNASGLSNSTQYYVRIRAIGDGTTTSNSPWSSTVSFTTSAGSGTPVYIPYDNVSPAWGFPTGWADGFGDFMYYVNTAAFPTAEANMATLDFTKGIKVDADQYNYDGANFYFYWKELVGGVPTGAAQDVTEVINVGSDYNPPSGPNAGDTLYEVHPNTTTTKRLFIGRGPTPVAGTIIVGGATIYS